MRFEVQKHAKRGIEYLERLGILYPENETKLSTTTPACCNLILIENIFIKMLIFLFPNKKGLFASAGCIPYVTNDLLKNISNLPNIVEIPLASMYRYWLFLN